MNGAPKILQNQSRLRPSIERELSALFHARTSAAAAYGSQFVRLWTLAGESVLGGKLVRPFLLLETYDALRDAESIAAPRSEPDPSAAEEEQCARETVIKIAAATELLHYSFLLHDDVIDGDLTRRGRPNLVGALLAESLSGMAGSPVNTEFTEPEFTDARLHWARTGGILMGDLLLSSTHQTFARAQLGHTVRVRLLDLLEHTITESVAGEQVDVGLSDGVITPDLGTILAMCANKTATYTFELPLRAAAILANSNPRLENTLVEAGRHLGLAFQLQDDLLSVFGDPTVHGKDAFSDLREGKQTALIAYARMTSAWPSIEPLFGRPGLSDIDGTRLRVLLAECGAELFLQGLVDEQLRSFYELLANPQAEIPAAVRGVLIDLAGQLEGRNA